MQARQVVAQEVRAILEEATGRTPKSWIVQEVMRRHADSFADEFGQSAGFDAIDAYVRKEVNRQKEPPSVAQPDPQTVLPGFERLQKGYFITSGGEPTYVPLDKMTNAELRAKANEYRRMGDGCHKHADEIDSYASQRNSA